MLSARPRGLPLPEAWPFDPGRPGPKQRPRFLTPSGGAVRPWSSGGNGRKGLSPFQGGRALWCRGSSAERKLPRLARGKAGRQERGGSSPCEQGTQCRGRGAAGLGCSDLAVGPHVQGHDGVRGAGVGGAQGVGAGAGEVPVGRPELRRVLVGARRGVGGDRAVLQHLELGPAGRAGAVDAGLVGGILRKGRAGVRSRNSPEPAQIGTNLRHLATTRPPG